MNDQQILWLVIGIVVVLVLIGLAIALGAKRRKRQREEDRVAAGRIRQNALQQEGHTRTEEARADKARREAEAAEAEAQRRREEARERERLAASSREDVDSQLRAADRLDPNVPADRSGRRQDGADPVSEDRRVGEDRPVEPGRTADHRGHTAAAAPAATPERAAAPAQEPASHQDVVREDLHRDESVRREPETRPGEPARGDLHRDETVQGHSVSGGSGKHAAPAPGPASEVPVEERGLAPEPGAGERAHHEPVVPPASADRPDGEVPPAEAEHRQPGLIRRLRGRG